jgi:DNA (cytosine-5)-methyltransferase 1
MPYRSAPYKEPEQPVGTVAELFAGVGGFRIALARSGWKTTFSNQWEPSTKAQHASDCYVRNFGAEGHSNVNFTELVEEHVVAGGKTIPRTDLLVGGFPCQDYSVAKSLNSSKGLTGKKGVLWWDIRRLVESNKPRYIFLENVDRLLKSPATQRGRDFAIMLRTLGSLGYLIEWRVVNAADYGFPQRRIRVFIVATRTRRKTPLSERAAKEVIQESGILARALPILDSDAPLTSIDLSAEPEALSDEFGKGGGRSQFLDAGVYLAGRAYTVSSKARLQKTSSTLGDVLVSDEIVAPEYWIPASRLQEWKYLKGAKSIQRTHKASGTSYEYAEGKMAFPDLTTNPSRTILTGEGGSSPSRFKHIILRPAGYRRLVPVELERLNGFPDDWTRFAGDGEEIKDARRAFFMGNALVVGLVARVGEVLADEMKKSNAS